METTVLDQVGVINKLTTEKKNDKYITWIQERKIPINTQSTIVFEWVGRANWELRQSEKTKGRKTKGFCFWCDERHHLLHQCA
jgi:hypothetical protein